MIPIPPAESLEINAFTTIIRVTIYKHKMNKSITLAHNPCPEM